eukprot:4633992-Prymnesium_polylepis.2
MRAPVPAGGGGGQEHSRADRRGARVAGAAADARPAARDELRAVLALQAPRQGRLPRPRRHVPRAARRGQCAAHPKPHTHHAPYCAHYTHRAPQTAHHIPCITHGHRWHARAHLSRTSFS